MLVLLIDIVRADSSYLDRLPSFGEYCDAIMLRGPDLPAQVVWNWGDRIQRLFPRVPLIINGHLEVARDLSADGLHLPSQHLPAQTVRQHWKKLLSASVHSLSELHHHKGADWVVWGHAFASSSKPGLPPRNRNSLHSIVPASEVPVLAIGGITAHTVSHLAGLGLSGVVVGDGIWQSNQPKFDIQHIQEIVSHPEWQGYLAERGR